MWISTSYRGDDEDKPRLVFNLFGQRGEYSAVSASLHITFVHQC